jgi:hypothetical protein
MPAMAIPSQLATPQRCVLLDQLQDPGSIGTFHWQSDFDTLARHVEVHQSRILGLSWRELAFKKHG